MSKKLLTLFGGSKDPVWIVRDQFTGTLAAGSVDGTPTSDGKGLRVVADTGSGLSIANALSITPQNIYGDPAISLTDLAGSPWTGVVAAFAEVLWGVGTNSSIGASLNTPPALRATGGQVLDNYRTGTSGIRLGTGPYLLPPIVEGQREFVLHAQCVAQRHFLRRSGATGAWALTWTTAVTANNIYPSIGSYSSTFTAQQLGAISLPANGDARFATDTGLATSTAATPAEAATGTHEAAFWLELNNVTRPSSGTITVNASVSGSDELTVSIAADGSIAVLENGVSRIAGAAGQITNGAIVRLRRSSATSCALFDDNAQVGVPYASLAVPQGTTWAVTSLGTGGAIANLYAWPYNVTLRGAAGRI